jgi:hypothetical protein
MILVAPRVNNSWGRRFWGGCEKSKVVIDMGLFLFWLNPGNQKPCAPFSDFLFGLSTKYILINLNSMTRFKILLSFLRVPRCEIHPQLLSTTVGSDRSLKKNYVITTTYLGKVVNKV